MIYKRLLKKKLFKDTSVFLLGPRQTGKSTYLRTNFNQSLYVDMLDNNLFFEFSRQPGHFSEYILAELKLNSSYKKYPVIVDEIQRLPILLNEVHKLIENSSINFILCGSSARKLIRGGANLLGGRAIRIVMSPLCIKEIQDFNILKYINSGGIPNHYILRNPKARIQAYVQNYMQEEILNEGLVRNLNSFYQFLDLVAISNGEEIKFSSIARDIGVDAKTVKEYYQILIDTLLGNFVYPYFDRRKRTNISKSPKLYLFDIGVANHLKGININKIGGNEFGRSFEHLIFNEILAYRNYNYKDFTISFWRTHEGDEVDFVLGDAQVAIEVKGGSRIDSRDLKALKKFASTYNPRKSIVVTNSQLARQLHEDILLLPYEEFINQLWQGKII